MYTQAYHSPTDADLDALETVTLADTQGLDFQVEPHDVDRLDEIAFALVPWGQCRTCSEWSILETMEHHRCPECAATRRRVERMRADLHYGRPFDLIAA